MKQGAFAALCGISQPMVSKYATSGFLVMAGPREIDPVASLAALEGRLSEDKRRAALETFKGLSTPPVADASVPRPAGAKAQKDELDVHLRRLQLAREAGEVVPVADVEDAAATAISALREALSNRKREAAQRICAACDLQPDKATAIARMLSEEFEAALGVFSAALSRCADGDASPVQPMPLLA